MQSLLDDGRFGPPRAGSARSDGASGPSGTTSGRGTGGRPVGGRRVRLGGARGPAGRARTVDAARSASGAADADRPRWRRWNGWSASCPATRSCGRRPVGGHARPVAAVRHRARPSAGRPVGGLARAATARGGRVRGGADRRARPRRRWCGHDVKELLRSLLPLGIDCTALVMDTRWRPTCSTRPSGDYSLDAVGGAGSPSGSGGGPDGRRPAGARRPRRRRRAAGRGAADELVAAEARRG